MRVGGQKMGQGYKSCINLNNWNHLFSPNSLSSQQGAINCFEHWARIDPISNTGMARPEGLKTRAMLSVKTKDQPIVDNRMGLKVTLVVTAIAVLYFAIFRK